MLLWFQSLFLGSRFQRSQSIVRMCGDLCSVFEYSDCVKECQVRNVARDQYSFKNNGFQLLQIPEIRSWFDEILAEDKPFDMYSRHSVEIFQLCVAHLRSKLDMESSFDNSSKDMVETEDEECATVGDSTQAIQPSIQFSNGSRWSLKSLIYRKPGISRNYGSTVHRDMDERAVKNAPDSTMFINIWIPLCTIYHDPLAILLPETVSDEDISGFKGLEYDRTGLKASDDHSWVYFDTMSLGDVLVWRTQDIYHAAFHIGEESQRFFIKKQTSDDIFDPSNNNCCAAHMNSDSAAVASNSYAIDPTALRPGDHIYVWKHFGIVPYQHHGIVTETEHNGIKFNIIVAHFSPESRGVRLVSLDAFLMIDDGSKGELKRAEYGCSSIGGFFKNDASYYQSAIPAHMTVELALSAAQGNHDGWADGRYHFVSNNCEAFANYCKLGQRPILTRQVAKIAVASTALAIAGGALMGTTSVVSAIGSHVASRNSRTWIRVGTVGAIAATLLESYVVDRVTEEALKYCKSAMKPTSYAS